MRGRRKRVGDARLVDGLPRFIFVFAYYTYFCAFRDSQGKHSPKILKYDIEDDGRSWRDIDTAEFVRIVQISYQEGSDRLIVDVREPEELEESGIIPGSINIPRSYVKHFAIPFDAVCKW